MESRVEGVELEIAAVKEQVGTMSAKMEEMNQTMVELGASVETIKTYLRDLRESTVGRETIERGKTPTEQEPSPSYSPPEREATMPQTGGNDRMAENEVFGAVRRDEELTEVVRRDVPFRRLDLPVYEGEGTINWIFKADRYFEVNRLIEREKLVAVGVCMEGEALSWFKWRVRRQAFSSWAEFQHEILKRFLADQDRSPYEELLSLRQTESVREYRRRFEMLSAAVEGVTEETLTTLFMNGLADDVRTEVRMFSPETLEAMMERALQVEEKNRVIDAKMGLRPGVRFARPYPRAQFSSPMQSYAHQPSSFASAQLPNPAYSPRHQPAHTTTRFVSSNQPTTQPISTRPSNNPLQSGPPKFVHPSHAGETQNVRGALSSVASVSQPSRERTFRRLSDEEF